MKRVLCISDSLGLPRPGVDYGQTWLSMLRNRIPGVDFISAFKRGGTTDMLASGDSWLFYLPQTVILQLGICDCSPRYLRTKSYFYRFLNKLPSKLSGIIWKFIKFFIKRSVKRTDVSIDKFYQNLKNYFDHCIEIKVERILVIKIAAASEIMVQANPLILTTIEQYNNVYESLAKEYSSLITLLDPLSISDNSYYLQDGYHPAEKGNCLVADSILKELSI